MMFRIFRKKPAGQDCGNAPAILPGGSFKGMVISDVGCVRPNNEDNYVLAGYMNDDSSNHSEGAVSSPYATGIWQLAGVFDGMGGGEMGELASHDTARIFLDSFGRLSGSPSKTEVDCCIHRAFLEANNRIVELRKEYRIYGTTATVLCTNGVEFKIYHLGDSRAYLIREDEMLQLTTDQTLAQMKLELGLYGEDDPAMETDKHKLTEYLGCDWTRENIKPVESQWITIQAGDRVLLCSDGLYDMCSDEEITGILLETGSTDEQTAALVNRAILNGGEDNITCIVAVLA